MFACQEMPRPAPENARMIYPDAEGGQQASGLTVTLKPNFAHSLVTALHGTHVSVYHHLGCGTLGANISMRRIIPTDEQLERLEIMGLQELVRPLGVSNFETIGRREVGVSFEILGLSRFTGGEFVEFRQGCIATGVMHDRNGRSILKGLDN